MENIRRWFDRFIDTYHYTDDELMKLYMEEQEKEAMRKEIALYKQTLLSPEGRISSS